MVEARSFKIVFALYPRVTQLDFTGPYEVFTRMPGAHVVVASKDGGDLVSEMGLTFANVAKLSDVEACDLIMVPGGPGQTEAMLDPAFMDEVKRLAATARYVTSVCTGSLILAAAGLLPGKRAGCHWAYRDLLAAFGAVPVADRVVNYGNIYSGGGVTAGIDIALTIVADLVSPIAAQAIQLSIEYAPEPPFDSGRPERASPEVVSAVQARFAAFAQERRAAIDELTRSA